MAKNELDELEQRLQGDLQAVARMLADLGRHASALQMMGFSSVVVAEIAEIRTALADGAEIPAAEQGSSPA